MSFSGIWSGDHNLKQIHIQTFEKDREAYLSMVCKDRERKRERERERERERDNKMRFKLLVIFLVCPLKKMCM